MRGRSLFLVSSALCLVLLAGSWAAAATVYPAAIFRFRERGDDVEGLGAKVTDLLFANLVANPQMYLGEIREVHRSPYHPIQLRMLPDGRLLFHLADLHHQRRVTRRLADGTQVTVDLRAPSAGGARGYGLWDPAGYHGEPLDNLREQVIPLIGNLDPERLQTRYEVPTFCGESHVLPGTASSLAPGEQRRPVARRRSEDAGPSMALRHAGKRGRVVRARPTPRWPVALAGPQPGRGRRLSRGTFHHRRPAEHRSGRLDTPRLPQPRRR